MRVRTIALAAAFCGFAATVFAADPNLARNLAATCSNCHGTDGKAVPGAGMERLAGVDKAKILEKLNDFRSGAKPATIMHQISKGYTDRQLEMIAEYFAAQR